MKQFSLSIRELFKLSDEGALRPALCQRNGSLEDGTTVWKKDEGEKLIFSIMAGFVIPALIFQSIKTGEWYILDGLQRLANVMAFLQSKFKLGDAFGEEAEQYARVTGQPDLLKLRGMTFAELPSKYQQRILNYTFVVLELASGIDQRVTEHMFKMLNSNGKPLSKGEKRNAMTGKAKNVVDMIIGHPCLNYVRGISTAEKDVRMNRRNLISMIVYMEHAGLGNITDENIDAMILRDKLAGNKISKQMETTLAYMDELFVSYRNKLSQGNFLSLYWMVSQRLINKPTTLVGKSHLLSTFLQQWDRQVNEPVLLENGNPNPLYFQTPNLNTWRNPAQNKSRLTATEMTLRDRILNEEYDKFLADLVTEKALEQVLEPAAVQTA